MINIFFVITKEGHRISWSVDSPYQTYFPVISYNTLRIIRDLFEVTVVKLPSNAYDFTIFPCLFHRWFYLPTWQPLLSQRHRTVPRRRSSELKEDWFCTGHSAISTLKSFCLRVGRLHCIPKFTAFISLSIRPLQWRFAFFHFQELTDSFFDKFQLKIGITYLLFNRCFSVTYTTGPSRRNNPLVLFSMATTRCEIEKVRTMELI